MKPSSFKRPRAYLTVRGGRDVSRMRSFCVSRPCVSSTIYTSFADGGRCPIVAGLFSLMTKTIPHSGSPDLSGRSQLLTFRSVPRCSGLPIPLLSIFIIFERRFCVPLKTYHPSITPLRMGGMIPCVIPCGEEMSFVQEMTIIADAKVASTGGSAPGFP